MCKLQCLISFTLCTMLVYCLLGKRMYPFIWHMFCHHSCLFSQTLFVNTGCLKWLSLLWTHLCRWYQTCKTVEFIHSDPNLAASLILHVLLIITPPPPLHYRVGWCGGRYAGSPCLSVFTGFVQKVSSCNHTWYGGAASWARVSHTQNELLSLRSRSQWQVK